MSAACAFISCDRPRVFYELCDAHGRQRRKGKKLSAIQARRKPLPAAERAALRAARKKWCPGCQNAKSESEFGRNAKKGLAAYCKQCVVGLNLTQRYRHPENRKANIRRAYLKKLGVSEQFYQALADLQGGVCAICGLPEQAKSNQTGLPMRLSLDHDHACCPGRSTCGKCIRGLLCDGCNRLGLAWYEGRLARGAKIFAPQFAAYLADPPAIHLGCLEDLELDIRDSV